MQATLEITRSHPRCRHGRLPARPPRGPGRLARPGRVLGMTASESITLLLREWRDGDARAMDQLRRELAPADGTGGADGA